MKSGHVQKRVTFSCFAWIYEPYRPIMSQSVLASPNSLETYFELSIGTSRAARFFPIYQTPFFGILGVCISGPEEDLD